MTGFNSKRQARKDQLQQENQMQNYIVLYRIESIMTALDSPFGFQCWAEDVDHAEEQCLNAEPDADIVWVWQGDEGTGMGAVFADYYAAVQL